MNYKPRRPQHRIQHHAIGLSKKQIKKYVVFSLVGVYLLIYFVYYVFSDECHGAWHTELLCAEYEAGNIGGHLCYDLCVQKKRLMSSSCERDGHGNLIFTINSSVAIKTRDRYPGPGQPPVTSLSRVYSSPEGGTSMAEFRRMVTAHLRSRLGEQEHTELTQQLINMADVNTDDKVSLAEAKTLMALLRQNEFLILQTLQSDTHLPRVASFCGETYKLNNLPYYRYLYSKSNSGLLHRLIPSAYTWGFPDWVSRAKIAIGLLDFVLEIHQHTQSEGSFYLCSLNESNVGYSLKYDVGFSNLFDVLPKRTLEAYVQDIYCTSDSQCRYTDHCTTICDKTTNKCTADLVQPNLSLVCDILRPFVIPDIPKPIRADFLHLIAKCSNLQTKDSDFDVQHSLLVNDLKSLLWRRISADI